MLLNPIISSNFKGIAIIQIFYNNSINLCNSLSKWIQIDNELVNLIMITDKITKYIETENNGNIIKLYNNKNEKIIGTYIFNNKHGIYSNNNLTGSVECLNLVDYIDESVEIEQPTNIIDYNDIDNFNNKKSFSELNFENVISTNDNDEIFDNISWDFIC